MQTAQRGSPGPEAAAGAAEMAEHAREAARLLKALAHEGRLMILCMLVEGERSVSELVQMLDASQPIVSQQLARLRAQEFVTTRRKGKHIYYSLANDEVREVVTVLYRLFCAGPSERQGQS
ncbi:MAG: metalloregulator ArsR/SmtB family transcription factor [Halofilum sp. (in: g-proteobacteria)]|nr:metalloregulator ArsR/SmtB family transcription factor [Halofilum sp. (in: g-proteobacteria)]